MSNYFGILFGKAGDAGWSEVYPITAASDANAATTLTTLWTDRRALAGLDVEFNGARLSNVDVKGDSIPLPDILIPDQGTFGSLPGDAAYDQPLALKIPVKAGTLKRGMRWVRALPKSQISAAGDFTPTTPYSTALAQYLTDLETLVAIATKIHGAVIAPFYIFTAITSAAQAGAEPRKIGRPFGQPRGRRLIA